MQRAARQLIRRACSGLRCEPQHGREVPGPQGVFFGAQQFRGKVDLGISRIAEPEKGKTKFNGYFAGGFFVNNVQVPGSVIAQADMYLLWKPRRIEEVTPESLVFIDLIAPTPDLLVLGCGLTPQPLPREVAAFLAERKMKVEVLNSRDATGYFNVLNEEGRVVVGALLALDPEVPLLENLPEQNDPLYDRPFLQQ
ncbi:NADH dehydrogenase 1 alpha subcomplex assembly factor 3 [Dunaliella salina]|uniref:NADH dehydrogenase 1 alpha subcomplex assembly factor 3 n=1 Tax=Dunaliella salina TaxID=3046 RepID=A0ABQ7GNI5_DUNSA|nr:NADH dehydrogenase 1 alpha subcomplex assembly factor 3 [Dunaliella salina]|eukprot:KAF5836167.1 NADH dehydrogenase 1 alpha subcomplex assembly factor 3 [Dunaliella salina]